MDKKIKEKWLAALRSGEYHQTREHLKKTTESGRESFCCLGVLCDVVNPKGWSKPTFDPCGDGIAQYPNYRGKDDYPPEDILAKAKLTRVTATVKGGSEKGKIKPVWEYLASMNDSSKKTFKQIADWIETNL